MRQNMSRTLEEKPRTAAGFLRFSPLFPRAHLQSLRYTLLHIQEHVGRCRHSEHNNGIAHVPHSGNGLDDVRQYFMDIHCAKVALAHAVSSDAMTTHKLFRGRLARMDTTCIGTLCVLSLLTLQPTLPAKWCKFLAKRKVCCRVIQQWFRHAMSQRRGSNP